MGGYDNTGRLAFAEVWVSFSGTFGPTGSLDGPRQSFTATLLADGRVLVVGGLVRGKHAAGSSLLQHSGNPWARISFQPLAATMAQGRTFHTATLLPDGRVLIAAATSTTARVNTAEVWSPSPRPSR